MTTTAYSYCTTTGQFGPYDAWNTGALSSSTTPYAELINPYPSRDHKTMEAYTPSWASGIMAGAEFVSMDIQLAMYNYAASTGSPYNFVVRQNGATVTTIDKKGTTSSSVVTYSGNAGYWGFTGTPQTIISQIKSGSIRFWFEGSMNSTDPYQERHVDTFAVRITYREPDTKRAALITALP